jgi:hypothetical protein
MSNGCLASADQPEPPQLERYQSDDDQVVIYNRLQSEWIAASPSSVVEVADDD